MVPQTQHSPHNEEYLYRHHLKADCSQCFGLCCTALAFTASTDFAMTKCAGQACHHLNATFQCDIHTHLREIGFRGCTVYDCFGAGQYVSRHTFQGRDWRQFPELASEMFAVFPVMTQLHELLSYLQEAICYSAATPVHPDLEHFCSVINQIIQQPYSDLLLVNIPELRDSIRPLLRFTSEKVRAEGRTLHDGSLPLAATKEADTREDWIGASLAGADLRYMDLRGAYLIAANLRQADLRWADFLGADLRDADFSDADLTHCIFLTQTQLQASKGNLHTLIPPALLRPQHWL
ncbi:uncharacterized protein YjbI with pentapeptide repeats [Paenibacillus shirakamiensis]|uniref:Uncharacterized protein YjbI with pentapeptide repeats n=1 Tax=Paenibacillus shirakamiensis TaxID=1265935 RepID=A0ABS4JEV1_9BACL|nr:pentapeptide repeat-containing protein [Paenibacillus shirakamiensis]MBP2000239.1 uncharacterized protein YjbI with pentapeptide repeats [Paenibacillus shirakamiensis]